MSIENQIEDKLLKSNSVKSLIYERDMSSLLKLSDWPVTDNPYYLDKTTNKHRELDVFGRRVYEIKEENLNIDINLIIECKSILGYHIIFSNKSPFYSSDEDVIWLGNNLEKKIGFNRILSTYNISTEQRNKLFGKIKERYYPNDRWLLSDYLPPFFQHLNSFNSFRETNIGNNKELENSVIWKSFLELKSVNKSIRSRAYSNLKDDLVYSIEKETKEPDSMAELLYAAIERYLSNPDLVHPIVLVDCDLWELSDTNILSKLNYCRLMQNDLYGLTTFWVDIVNRHFFKDYISSLSKHYQGIMEYKKADRRI